MLGTVLGMGGPSVSKMKTLALRELAFRWEGDSINNKVISKLRKAS